MMTAVVVAVIALALVLALILLHNAMAAIWRKRRGAASTCSCGAGMILCRCS